MTSNADDGTRGDDRGVPAFTDATPAVLAKPRGERSIGALLVDTGKLRVEDAERIMQLQREKGLRFGDAALQLGLLSHADLEFALSRQFHYPYLRRGESKVSETVVAAYDPLRREVEPLRLLRSQLMLRWFDGDPSRRVLAIISSARGEGRSFIAANLAVVFAQLGERTLLIDADMRNPCQHRLFGVDDRLGFSTVLSGRAGLEVVQRVPALGALSVLTAGAAPPNPHELLARPVFGALLDTLAAQYDVVLLDTPAAGEATETQSLVLRAGAALIVTRTNATRAWRVQGMSENVAQAKASIVGTILNDY
jgi:chain length determinant protein tyrosine kinase EpsG